MCVLIHVQLFATLWTVACQVPLSMGFFRQEYWSGLPLPPPGDLPDPGIKPVSPALWADSLSSEPSRRSLYTVYLYQMFDERMNQYGVNLNFTENFEPRGQKVN